jgi:hypothetical protein
MINIMMKMGKQMRNRDCSSCLWAKFKRYNSGIRNLKKGECTYKAILPNSYQNFLGDFPAKKEITKTTGQYCLCWALMKD